MKPAARGPFPVRADAGWRRGGRKGQEMEKKRIRMIVAYDGTNYHGWQIQPNGITIESELNGALSTLFGEPIKVSGASRTDTGVHSLGNLAVFDVDTRMPAEKILMH